MCLSATTTHTWRWNISGQVRLISRPRQTDAQTRQLIYRILTYGQILINW
jgi:hypothetical protein